MAYTSKFSREQIDALLDMVGSGSGIGEDVVYRDYDGTVLHSYSKADFLALKEHPELPEREGLICEEWNWSLESAQSYVADYGKCEIGATYITDDGKTRLYIKITDKKLTNVTIKYFQVNSRSATVDWGDGSASYPLTGTSYGNETHTYSNIGEYIITIDVKDGALFRLGDNNGSYGILGQHYMGDWPSEMLYAVEIGKNTGINSYAFSSCYSLESVVIPKDSITSISSYAFSSCRSLKSIVIPKGMESINDNAFSSNTNLKSISLPEGLKSIGGYAFNLCSSLKTIVIPRNLQLLSGFNMCRSIESVTIPDGITSISSNAFTGCNSLKSVIVDESSMANVFKGLSSLKSALIKDGKTSIDEYLFQDCTSLASIEIPKSVTSIGQYAFSGCDMLQSITILEGTISIGSYAFQNCYSLASIEIPKSVTSIGQYAFYRCRLIPSVVIPEGIEQLSSYTFALCYSLKSCVLPDSLTAIDDNAFANCCLLSSIVIPKNVTSIGKQAFYYCRSLLLYDFRQLESIPTLASNNAFDGMSSNAKIVVPDALYDEWIAATNWSSYASKIVKASEYTD